MQSTHNRRSALAIASLRLAPTTFVGHCGNATPAATRVPLEIAMHPVPTGRHEARPHRRSRRWMTTFATHLARRAETILSRRS